MDRPCALCQSDHILLFREVKSLPRRYLLLRFYGRYGYGCYGYGRSQEAFFRLSESGLGATRTAHHSARLSASAPPPAMSLGIRGRAHTLLCFCVLCCALFGPSRRAQPTRPTTPQGVRVVWPRRRGRPARQCGLPRVVFHTPCPVCIVPLPRMRGGRVRYHVPSTLCRHLSRLATLARRLAILLHFLPLGRRGQGQSDPSNITWWHLLVKH
jgi:hypothetical protein